MPISGSGSVSFSQIRTEYVGGNAAISASQLYRGGTNIRQKAADNQGQNQASTVPTSGTITADNFRGTAKGFKYTYNADATNQDISDLFGADYSVDYPKEVVIASGVELGATSLAEEALEADNGLTGNLKITNQGTLTGRGGAAGQAGGDAFEANVTCTFINEGTLRAGGGGGGNGGAGGRGGTGGQGRYNSTSSAWTPYYANLNNYRLRVIGNTPYHNGANADLRWAGSVISNSIVFNSNSYSNYGFGTIFWTGGGSGEDDPPQFAKRVRRYQTTTNTHYTNGGAGGYGGSGGAGGTGAGYQQTAASGSSGAGGQSGSGGGTNAGTGGTGGTGGAGGAGGAFGAAGTGGSTGATGNTGGSGNHNNGAGGQGGSAGGSAGASGKYLRGSSNVTFTNNGTVQGAIV